MDIRVNLCEYRWGDLCERYRVMILIFTASVLLESFQQPRTNVMKKGSSLSGLLKLPVKDGAAAPDFQSRISTKIRLKVVT